MVSITENKLNIYQEIILKYGKILIKLKKKLKVRISIILLTIKIIIKKWC